MSDERTERAASAVRDSGADWAVLTSFDDVFYAAGHEATILEGPSPHQGGPTAAMVARDGAVALVVSDVEGDAAQASRAELVHVYEAFAPQPHETPLTDAYRSAIADMVGRLGLGGVVAVQPGALPLAVGEVLHARGCRLVDVGPAMCRVRATKTPEEIVRLGDSAALTAAGQEASRRHAAAGVTELDLFATARQAMERAAGEALAMGADLVSGPERTGNGTGAPSGRVLDDGDPVICDLWPRLRGYWGDSCTSFAVGEPSKLVHEMYAAALRGLERALEMLRPGITAGDLDAAARAPVTAAGFENPLHIGHGIGAANFEYPRIVPGAREPIEPDMVLMLEPGAYRPGAGGVRLEWMLHVTADGARVLSPYPH